MPFGSGSRCDSLRNLTRKIKTTYVYADPAPWASAPDSLRQNNDLDPHRFALRGALVREEAQDFRLAEAIQFRRTDGMGSQRYDMIWQMKLEAVLARLSVTSQVR